MKLFGSRPTIGLALGSGGAKGLAHIGVIKVLERENIPIDYIAGTSIGALVGAAYASMKDIHKLEQLALQLNWPQLLPIFLEPSIRHGLLRGQRISTLIQKYVDEDFSGLKIPFTAVATDLVGGKTVTFSKGNLVDAVRASISIPILFKPVLKDGMILVDGGTSMPVPVQVVRDMGADIVIAVNVNETYADIVPEQKYGFNTLISRSVATLTLHLARENAQLADVVIYPKVGTVGLFSKFMTAKGSAAVIKSGEIATDEVLPKILQCMSVRQPGILPQVKRYIGKIIPG